jgi:histidinol phosphatase-like enzyme
MVREELLYATEYVPVKSLKTTKTIQDYLWCKNVPATSIFDTKQVAKPTSDTLMETPKTSILQPTKLYPVGQATSDSKDSSTPGLTYSPNVA